MNHVFIIRYGHEKLIGWLESLLEQGFFHAVPYYIHFHEGNR